MSYFMRYLFTGDTVTLAEIDAALRTIDANFRIQFEAGDVNSGDLYYEDDVFGEIALNMPGETVYNEDLDELRELIAPIDDPLKPMVATALDNAHGMVALLVLEAGHVNPDILEQLWDWLFDHAPGVLQVDDEGFYDYEKLVLPTTADE
ncbi:MAG: hypothetical protein SF123_16655 [Chloroflexota bacterium]|nr:hypothetical protein [Chloroflexota bacterium]